MNEQPSTLKKLLGSLAASFFLSSCELPEYNFPDINLANFNINAEQPDVIGSTEHYRIDHDSKTAIFPHDINEYTIRFSEGDGFPIGLVVLQHLDNEHLSYLNDTYIEWVEFDGTKYSLEDLEHFNKLITPTIEQYKDWIANTSRKVNGYKLFKADCSENDIVSVFIEDGFSEDVKTKMMKDLSLYETITTDTYVQVATREDATLRINQSEIGTNIGLICRLYIDPERDWTDPKNQGIFHHEIMHASFSMGHAGYYDKCNPSEDSCKNSRIFTNDNKYETLMSYFLPSSGFRPRTLSPLDILAIQSVVEPNTETNNGDNIYRLPENFDPYIINYPPTIYDTGGKDTFDLSSSEAHYGMDINLCGGATSQVALQTQYRIAFNTVIENVITSKGSDTIRTCPTTNVDNNIQTGDGPDKVYINEWGKNKVDGGEGYDVVELALSQEDMGSLKFTTDLTSNTINVIHNKGTLELINVERLEIRLKNEEQPNTIYDIPDLYM